MTYVSYVFVLFNVESVVHVVDVTLITARKPFGVRMCEELCNKYNCGSSLAYDVSTLTCDIYDNETAPSVSQNASYYRGVTAKVDFSTSMSKIWTKIQEQHKKRQPYRGALKTSTKNVISKDSSLVDRNKRTWSRLLVAPYLTSKPTGLIVYSFVDKSVQSYQHILEKRVSSVIYIPSLKSIWISTTRHIKSHIINRNGSHIVVKLYRSEVYSMAVDDARGLVFVSRYQKRLSKLILTYTTKGKELCRYTVDSEMPVYITIDRNSKTIFYNNPKQIRFTDYTFEIHGKVILCHLCRVIAYDAIYKMLYFQTEGGYLMKHTSGRTETLTVTKKSLMFIFRDRHHILFTRKYKPFIIMLDSAKKQKMLLKHNRFSSGLLMCALD